MRKPHKSACFSLKKDRLASLLACGVSIREAAKQTNVGERTIYDWLSDDAFVKLIDRYRARLIDECLGKLSDFATKAATALAELLKSDVESIRLRAAIGVLEQVIRIRETVTMEARLAELERMVKGERQRAN